MAPVHPTSATLTLAQARRAALAAQGLHRPRPERTAPVTMRQVQQVIDRLGLLQIDSVNVLARAHLMPMYSRLGPYDTALLDRAAGRAPRRLVEYWAHEASLVPPQTYRLLAWRQEHYRERSWGTIAGVPVHSSPLRAEVLALLTERGAMTAAQVQDLVEHDRPRRSGSWWDWSGVKRALEHLFLTGELACARRTAQFERVYDLTARVLPAAVQATPVLPRAEAVMALVEQSAAAHGIGTLRCLADYFRIKPAEAKIAVDALVEEGRLRPVAVRGWDRPAYLHAEAAVPRKATGRALLSPFDPLVFERRRLAELFGMHYRIEIYTPAHQRVYGYYSLPFLLGDRPVARVDLKADRRDGVLRVMAAHAEPGAPAHTAVELAAELDLMARWLGLGDVVLGGQDVPAGGGLAAELGTAKLLGQAGRVVVAVPRDDGVPAGDAVHTADTRTG